jgi:chromosome partitioning protein
VNTTKEEKALEDKCKVIAIANQKGGVGKTTTAVNLGVALGFSGKRVLLIDTDPQGSLTKSCKIDNADADALDVTLSELMANEMTGEDKDYSLINKAIKQFENIDLIPANISLSGTETALFNCMSRESVLKRTIEPLKQKYDYILIDCMPSLGMMTINALVAADSVIIPCEPSFLSVKGLDLLLHSISKVKRQINPSLKIDGVLLTMVDYRTNNAREITGALRDAMGNNINVFNIEIPRSVRATECPNVGESIFVHDPGGKVAEAYALLAKEVNGLERKTQVRPRPHSVR